eukprot:373723_1
MAQSNVLPELKHDEHIVNIHIEQMSLDKIEEEYILLLKYRPHSINQMFKFCFHKNYKWEYWQINEWWTNTKTNRNDEKKPIESGSNELEMFVAVDKDAPLSKFTVNDICYVIIKWIYNDIDYKKHILQTERIFADHKLGLDKIMILSVDDVKRIVKDE